MQGWSRLAKVCRRRSSNDRIRGGASLRCLRGLHAAWTSAASSGSAATGPPPPRADAREVHGAHLRRRQDRRRGRACVPRPGVMHRDLKPEKFLYAGKSPDARLKAIDFGLSVFFRLAFSGFKSSLPSQDHHSQREP
ncbi:hypothetical protein PVAP13_J148700 [Panicum virgatum]|nr:hypothetical protein PVAP13_J148700 [Panicum virgatum]